jgi:hypothetical protein
MDLLDCLNRLPDQESFLDFAHALMADKEDEDKKEKRIRVIPTAMAGVSGKTLQSSDSLSL